MCLLAIHEHFWILILGISKHLTDRFLPIFQPLDLHSPFSVALIPFGLCDTCASPDIELHCICIEFEPIRKLVLWREDLAYLDNVSS